MDKKAEASLLSSLTKRNFTTPEELSINIKRLNKNDITDKWRIFFYIINKLGRQKQ